MERAQFDCQVKFTHRPTLTSNFYPGINTRVIRPRCRAKRLGNSEVLGLDVPFDQRGQGSFHISLIVINWLKESQVLICMYRPWLADENTLDFLMQVLGSNFLVREPKRPGLKQNQCQGDYNGPVYPKLGRNLPGVFREREECRAEQRLQEKLASPGP